MQKVWQWMSCALCIRKDVRKGCRNLLIGVRNKRIKKKQLYRIPKTSIKIHDPARNTTLKDAFIQVHLQIPILVVPPTKKEQEKEQGTRPSTFLFWGMWNMLPLHSCSFSVSSYSRSSSRSSDSSDDARGRSRSPVEEYISTLDQIAKIRLSRFKLERFVHMPFFDVNSPPLIFIKLAYLFILIWNYFGFPLLDPCQRMLCTNTHWHVPGCTDVPVWRNCRCRWNDKILWLRENEVYNYLLLGSLTRQNLYW